MDVVATDGSRLRRMTKRPAGLRAGWPADAQVAEGGGSNVAIRGPTPCESTRSIAPRSFYDFLFDWYLDVRTLAGDLYVSSDLPQPRT